MLRTNVSNMANPDPYANVFGAMIPTSTVRTTPKLLPKNFQNTGTMYDEAVQNAANSKKELPEWQKQETDLGTSLITNSANTLKNASQFSNAAQDLFKAGKVAKATSLLAKAPGASDDVIKGAGDAAKAAGSAKNALAGAGIGLGASAIKMGVAANADKKIAQASNNMNTDAYMKAQWQKGLATDNMVSNIGGTAISVGLAPILTPAGSAAVAEGFKLASNAVGTKLKAKKLKSEFQTKIADHKKSVADTEAYNEEVRRELARQKDRIKYQGLVNNAQMIGSGAGNPILFAKKGTKLVTKFRRGGELDLQKENVILDGPSHDDINNTGIKGDKGLPVVHKNVKTAEIESLELVMNEKASSELEKLVKNYKKTKDKSVLDKIGDLTSKEINTNTYDYSKELLD